MTVAEHKKQENICEYMLYMWQMEDLMRSASLDAESLFEKLGFGEDEQSELEKEWFRGLARKMKSEKLEKAGHLAELGSILGELFLLHNTLLGILKDKTYTNYNSKSEPFLKNLMEKAKGEQNPIEHILVALYGLLILRLQKKSIHEETEKAMKTFSTQMAYLSEKYNEMKQGILNSDKN